MTGGQRNRHRWFGNAGETIAEVIDKRGVVAGVFRHIDFSDGPFFYAIFVHPEMLDLRQVPGTVGETQGTFCAEDSRFVWHFTMNACAAFVAISQARVELHKGDTVLFDVGFDFPVGEDFYAVSGKGAESNEFWDIVEQAEVKRQVINAPVEDRSAAGEGFFQRPAAPRVVFDESPSHQVIMVDVKNFSDITVVYHLFNEMKFGLKARVSGGTHEDDKIFEFGGFADEAIHLGSIYDHRFFEQ